MKRLTRRTALVAVLAGMSVPFEIGAQQRVVGLDVALLEREWLLCPDAHQDLAGLVAQAAAFAAEQDHLRTHARTGARSPVAYTSSSR